MRLPALLDLPDEDAYFLHFVEHFCKQRITTFDGIPVHFSQEHFWHAFYKSKSRSRRSKDLFDRERAIRMDWIKSVLSSPDCEFHVGWDREKRRFDPARRVALFRDYVVVIQISADRRKAMFITAFTAGESTLKKIKKSPQWQKAAD